MEKEFDYIDLPLLNIKEENVEESNNSYIYEPAVPSYNESQSLENDSEFSAETVKEPQLLMEVKSELSEDVDDVSSVESNLESLRNEEDLSSESEPDSVENLKKSPASESLGREGFSSMENKSEQEGTYNLLPEVTMKEGIFDPITGDVSQPPPPEETVFQDNAAMDSVDFSLSSKPFSRLRDPSKPFSCLKCSQRFKTNNRMKLHVCKAGITHPCDICGKHFATTSSLNAHRRLHAGPSYKCVTCGKLLTTKNSLISHQQRHLEIKPYVCDFCNKGFVKKHYLVEHRRIHLGIRPYKCDQCEKAFTRNTHLAMHKGAHLSQFSCDICKKTFTRKGQLVEHQRVHTGLKPHKCDICGKCYTRKTHLRTHRNTHPEAHTDPPILT